MRKAEKLARRLIRNVGLKDLEDEIVDTAVLPHIDNTDSFHAAQSVCTFPIYDLGPTIERTNISNYLQDSFLRDYYIDAHNNASWLMSSLNRAKMRRSEREYADSLHNFQQEQADFFLSGVRDRQLDNVQYLIDPRSAHNYAGVRLDVARNTGLVSEDEADALAELYADAYMSKFGNTGR